MKNSTLFWLGISAILTGVTLIVVGFFLSDSVSTYHNPFLSYLATNFGGLLVFGASYTLISEGYLRQGLSKDMSIAVAKKIEHARANNSFLEAGISEVMLNFSSHVLHDRLKNAQTVKMVVVKNALYFREYCDSIRSRVEDGRLSLEVLIPDPSDAALMNVISRRYDEYENDDLADSIIQCIETWIIGRVFGKLTENSKDNLQVYTNRQNPLYSAYLFDRNELWYIPYCCRIGRHQIPIFVFRDIDEDLQIYRDILELFRNSQKLDLRQERPFEKVPFSEGRGLHSNVA